MIVLKFYLLSLTCLDARLLLIHYRFEQKTASIYKHYKIFKTCSSNLYITSNRISTVRARRNKYSSNEMFRVLRCLTFLAIRKLRRCSKIFLLWPLVTMMFHIWIIWKTFAVHSFNTSAVSVPEGFTAIGQSPEFPAQWRYNKVDPLYKLVLVGDETSPGK